MPNFFFRLDRKKNLSLEESIERIQNGDIELRNEILEQFIPFIIKTVSSVCRRFISENDDEFSIGLIAFNEALEKFTPEKGKSVLSFAEFVIKSRVIDYIRKEAKTPDTVHFFPQEIDNEEGSYTQDNKIEADISINEHQREMEKRQIQEEIVRFQMLLKSFGLSMKDLLNQAPKHIDARINALEIAKTIIQNEELKNAFWTKKRLPIKELENLVSVSRKTIERNRKYIISLVIILDGDFTYMKDYLRVEV